MDGMEEIVKVFGLGMVGLVGGMSLVGHKVCRFHRYSVLTDADTGSGMAVCGLRRTYHQYYGCSRSDILVSCVQSSSSAFLTKWHTSKSAVQHIDHTSPDRIDPQKRESACTQANPRQMESKNDKTTPIPNQTRSYRRIMPEHDFHPDLNFHQFK
jgi:hypothetical protein